MLKAYYKSRNLYFNFSAYTSRGTLTEKQSWFLIIESDQTVGIGECSPIVGLSIDPILAIDETLNKLCQFINMGNDPLQYDLSNFPSIKFGLECALLQIEKQQKHLLYKSDFTSGKAGIAINGLVWAGNFNYVIYQVNKKIETGFPCIKLKIGALPFDEDLAILTEIRKLHPHIEIRLDANGAFSKSDALKKLELLSKFNIHSIEQPIAPQQFTIMADLCCKSPIPIALDEELISIKRNHLKRQLLETIHPSYIIIKPTLLGGFSQAEEWIKIADQLQIRWWVTSALETNVGLNAIAQWTYSLKPNQIHGLGTGMLYKNNISSPLFLKKGKLFYNPNQEWENI